MWAREPGRTGKMARGWGAQSTCLACKGHFSCIPVHPSRATSIVPPVSPDVDSGGAWGLGMSFKATSRPERGDREIGLKVGDLDLPQHCGFPTTFPASSQVPPSPHIPRLLLPGLFSAQAGHCQGLQRGQGQAMPGPPWGFWEFLHSALPMGTRVEGTGSRPWRCRPAPCPGSPRGFSGRSKGEVLFLITDMGSVQKWGPKAGLGAEESWGSRSQGMTEQGAWEGRHQRVGCQCANGWVVRGTTFPIWDHPVSSKLCIYSCHACVRR